MYFICHTAQGELVQPNPRRDLSILYPGNYILARSVSKLIRFCQKVHQLDLFSELVHGKCTYIRRSVPLMLPSTRIHYGI